MYRTFVVACAVATSLALVPVDATVSYAINTQGNVVDVDLSNPDSVEQSGTVEIEVDLGGSSEQARVPFRVAAGDRVIVSASFSSPVVAVTSVSIISEDPDPIGT